MTPAYSTDQKVFVVQKFNSFGGYLESKYYQQFAVNVEPSSALPNVFDRRAVGRNRHVSVGKHEVTDTAIGAVTRSYRHSDRCSNSKLPTR
jgi:hypothetical protein